MGVKTDTELARVLGIDHSSVAGARKRNNIPPKWIIDVSERFGISADWLLFGDGAMFRAENVKEILALRTSQRDELVVLLRRLLAIHLLILGLTGENKLPLSEKDRGKLLNLFENNVFDELNSVVWDLSVELTKLIPEFIWDFPSN